MGQIQAWLAFRKVHLWTLSLATAHATPQSACWEVGSLQLVAAMLQSPSSAEGSWRMSVSRRRERALCPQQPGLQPHSGWQWVQLGPDSAPWSHLDLANPPPLMRSEAQLRSRQGPVLQHKAERSQSIGLTLLATWKHQGWVLR